MNPFGPGAMTSDSMSLKITASIVALAFKGFLKPVSFQTGIDKKSSQ